MMFRTVVAAFITLYLVPAIWAQSLAPATPAAPAAAKPATKKPAAKPKPVAAKPISTVESGPCSLGVISAIGDRFAVQKAGLTIFENEQEFVPIEDWGLDALVLARVRAATGNDPSVHKITYPKGALEPYFNPKARLLPDPSEGLPALVQGFTASAHCDRYLVVARTKGEFSGSHIEINGVGALNQGLGSLLRHSHLFAVFSITMLDGSTYQAIQSPFAGFGARFSQSLRVTEDPLNKLDNSEFPDPPAAAASSAVLREKARALVATRLDQVLPEYLKRE